ncbi:MAG: biopolymer transporter ExbD [Kofleriaceae bacterium]
MLCVPVEVAWAYRRGMGMSAGRKQNEINVTPLIDVLLVLLIIFLVLMPIMTRIEPVLLPANEPSGDPETPILVVVHGDLGITIDESETVEYGDLQRVLRLRVKPSRPVFVEVDDGVQWQHVVGVVDSIRGLARDPSHEEIPVAVRIRQAEVP